LNSYNNQLKQAKMHRFYSETLVTRCFAGAKLTPRKSKCETMRDFPSAFHKKLSSYIVSSARRRSRRWSVISPLHDRDLWTFLVHPYRRPINCEFIPGMKDIGPDATTPTQSPRKDTRCELCVIMVQRLSVLADGSNETDTKQLYRGGAEIKTMPNYHLNRIKTR